MPDWYTIEHDSGRMLFLEELWQFQTHRNLMMGQPTREMNREEIARTLQEARRRYRRVALIEPPEQLLEINPYDVELRELLVHAPEWQPVGIPQTTCVGSFRSFPGARDPQECYSALTVIWYQERFALPIADEALTKIKALDWARLADDATD